MNRTGNLENFSRRNFLRGKISLTKTRSSSKTKELNVKLINCFYNFDSRSNTLDISYGISNIGENKSSVLIKFGYDTTKKVINLIHLNSKETYNGTWTEKEIQLNKSYSIEIEARCNQQKIHRFYDFYVTGIR
jgi:hypothetical protein